MNFVQELINHCESGYSFQSFAGKLKGGNWKLSKLLKESEEFRQVANKYKTKRGRTTLISSAARGENERI